MGDFFDSLTKGVVFGEYEIPVWLLGLIILVLTVIIISIIVLSIKNKGKTSKNSFKQPERVQTQKATTQSKPLREQTAKPTIKNSSPPQKKNSQSNKKEEIKPSGKFEILLKIDGYRFYLIANNGQLLYESTGYTTSGGAAKGIDTFKKAVEKGSFVVDEDKFGRFRFILNKRYAGENYTSRAQCESSIESVKNFSKSALMVPYERDEEAEKAYSENKNAQTPLMDYSKIEEKERDIKRSGKFEIIECPTGFCFYLTANNGQLLYSSNSYASFASAKDAIKNFKKTVYGGNFVVDKDKFGRYRFILRGNNFYATYIGESYTTKTACEKNINSVKNFSKSAVMPD